MKISFNKLLSPSWQKILQNDLNSAYMQNVAQFIQNEIDHGKIVYPKISNIFAAFNFTDFDNVKIVIIGQDPYHNPNEAQGLSFSVPKNIKIPPSLRNIFKELANDIGIEPPTHGNLENWAKQGVLLLNSVLTVNENEPTSHRNIGWEQFTNKVIEVLVKKKSNIVFILWGNDAKKKLPLIDTTKHLVLTSGHPSPLSVRHFLGNKHFSSANKYLATHQIDPINWQI